MDSLFERIGGAAAVDAAVELFYQKVLDDPLLRPWFEGVEMNGQAAMQKNFLTMAFGGPNNYTGRDLTDAHARLVADGLNDSHFNAVAGHLQATLEELGVPAELVGEAMAIAGGTHDAILGVAVN